MKITAAVAAALVASMPLDAAVPDTQKDPRFGVDVERVMVEARAVDGRGNPIRGLGATHFQVKVDGKPVSLESATWVTGSPPDGFLPDVSMGAEDGVADGVVDRLPAGDVVVGGVPPGRLIVMFFQKDFDSSRAPGLLRMQSKAARFLETLGPEDRVAVLSFDYHLKLWQDFTNDREKLKTAVRRTLFFGKFPSGQSGEAPSMAAEFDFEAAKRAAEPESALLVIARALRPVPGPKSLIFFGWGMGTMSGSRVFMDSDYGPAVQALLDARTTVFTLDVTDADYHTLEVGLEAVAADTGGFYAKTHLFPGLAMARLEGALAGHYLLAFERPGPRRGVHRVEIKLRGVKGEVMAKGVYVD